MEIVRCKRCGRKLTNPESIERKYGMKCYRIIQLQKSEVQEEPENFNMNEIKLFITSEIQEALKDFNFNKPVNNKDAEDKGIVPVKTAKKMPKFNILEVSKRLVVKELKEQIQKGINNILQDVGSFDNQINFLEVPIGILV